MNCSLIDRFTPRAFPKTRLLTAAHVWLGVGIFLSIKGVVLLAATSWQAVMAAICCGALLGFVKSRLIFDRVAEKIITHIRRKPSQVCLGGLFSIKNWTLIAIMIGLGRGLAALPLAPQLKSTIYIMVGSGLAYSSRRLWIAWRKTVPIAIQNLRR